MTASSNDGSSEVGAPGVASAAVTVVTAVGGTSDGTDNGPSMTVTDDSVTPRRYRRPPASSRTAALFCDSPWRATTVSCSWRPRGAEREVLLATRYETHRSPSTTASEKATRSTVVTSMPVSRPRRGSW
ncbi:Uncharacterised protein [Mycobacteroides abscessus]|nr:Uncharacterised protein [Mycobacteroides abscessus]